MRVDSLKNIDEVCVGIDVVKNARRDETLDLADLLGRSRTWIYEQHDCGVIPPAVRLAERLVWSRSSILKWIDDGCPKSTTPQDSTTI